MKKTDISVILLNLTAVIFNATQLYKGNWWTIGYFAVSVIVLLFVSIACYQAAIKKARQINVPHILIKCFEEETHYEYSVPEGDIPKHAVRMFCVFKSGNDAVNEVNQIINK